MKKLVLNWFIKWLKDYGLYNVQNNSIHKAAVNYNPAL